MARAAAAMVQEAKVKEVAAVEEMARAMVAGMVVGVWEVAAEVED